MRTYITTRKISRVGNSIGVYVPALWDEFVIGDKVRFTLYNIDRPERSVTVIKTIRNANKKGTRTVTCGHLGLDLKIGDIVVFSMTRVDDDEDTGIEAEE